MERPATDATTCSLCNARGGWPALATYRGGALVWLDTVEIAGGRITAFRRMVNPEKLAHIGHI